MILLCAEFLCFGITLFRDIKKVEQKWIKWLIFVSSIIIGLVCGAVIIEMFFELFRW